MIKISRCIAEKYFKKELMNTIVMNFKTFDNCFEKEALFFVNKDMVISFMHHENYNNCVYLASLNGGNINFRDLFVLFESTKVDTFAKFLNKRLMRVVLKRYKKNTTKFKDNTILIHFR